MGQEIWDRIGPDYYAVGFTAATGEAGLLWMDSFQLHPPAKGSIEELFRDAGFENAFLDLRHIPAGGEWLHEPLLSRPFGYSYSIACWSRHLDGLVFTRVMEPSTRMTSSSLKDARWHGNAPAAVFQARRPLFVGRLVDDPTSTAARSAARSIRRSPRTEALSDP